MTQAAEIIVGQVYEDKDKRRVGRTVTVLGNEPNHGLVYVQSNIGTKTAISEARLLNRFKLIEPIPVDPQPVPESALPVVGVAENF